MTRGQEIRRRRLAARRKRSDIGKPLLYLLIPIVAISLISGMALIASAADFYAGVQDSAKTPGQAITDRGGGAKIYARNGQLLYEYLDQTYGYQTPVKLDQIAPDLQHATIAVEDASFYQNPGINVRGLTRAALENLKPGDAFLQGSGGSSITQQLVKQIYFSPEERGQRTLGRKLREAALSLQITQAYTKDQILEWYLNEIPYGGNFTGIEAASQGYFGVPAANLTLSQAAFLAGLPQSPARLDPFTNFDAAKARQFDVLELMVVHGYITQQLADWAKLDVIQLNPVSPAFLAPHFVQYVGDYIKQRMGEEALYHGGLSVWTTLDLDLQLVANDILETNLQTYEASTDGHNGSVVVMSPPTGQILAMVGSRDYFRDDIDGTVNNALALNSPGSTLKPFTYATAFQQGWSPDWPIIDSKITYKEADGKEFTPRNPDGRFRGVVTLKQALGNSFNIPAFKTILWVGVQNMIATTKAMGITTLDRELGPALTLGGTDVKLLDMVYGYSTFANNGAMVGQPTTETLPAGNRNLDPISVLLIRNRTGSIVLNNTAARTDQAIRPEYAYLVTDTLANDENRQITYGRGSSLNIEGWRVAAKTGTSEPYEGNKLIGDTWTFGYTPDIAVGVWVGNSDNRPMVNIFSTTIAGRTWHDVMARALAGRTPRDFVKPDGIVEATVCVPSGLVFEKGMNCPTVKGLFAEDALKKQTDRWWGGQGIGALGKPKAGSVPEELTGWKRTLAEEYLRMYRGGRPAQRTSAPTPVATVEQPTGQAPAAPAPLVAEPTPQPAEPQPSPAPIATPAPR